MSDNEKKKTKFRSSQKWKNFRKDLKKNQKTDPITGSKLSTTATCHHKDLNIQNYEMISEERQVMLNPMSHDVLHYVYGDERKRHDWKRRLAALERLCEEMDKYNGEYSEG